MKFDDKYPEVVKLYKARVQSFEPAPWHDEEFRRATEPEPCLVFSGRYYACDTGLGGCGKATAWVDIGWGVGVHCCSEECQKTMWDRYDEAASKAGSPPAVEVTVVSTVPAGPVVEVPPVLVQGDSVPAVPSLPDEPSR